MTRLVDVGRLLRLSLLPTAAADVAAGAIVGGAGVWPGGATPWLLIGASLGVYHGAMALNDWADREGDRATRPGRPIPSGAVSAGSALALAVLLLGGGVALGALVSARVAAWVAALAVLAVVYDVAGRGPVLGPTLLAVCRAGNVGLGTAGAAWAAGREPGALAFAPALLYGAYVSAIGRLGRLEDDEDPAPLGRRPVQALGSATAFLALAPAFASIAVRESGLGATATTVGALASLVPAWLGAAGLVRLARRREPWTRPDVERATVAALRRLLLFTSSVALAYGGVGPDAWIVAGAILCGYPVAGWLRRAFPMS